MAPRWTPLPIVPRPGAGGSRTGPARTAAAQCHALCLIFSSAYPILVLVDGDVGTEGGWRADLHLIGAWFDPWWEGAVDVGGRHGQFRHRERHVHGLRLARVEAHPGEPDQPLGRDHDRADRLADVYRHNVRTSPAPLAG